MKNIILNLTPAMQATTGGIDPQRQIALEVCMAIKGEPGQAGGGRKAFKPGVGVLISSADAGGIGIEVYGPAGEPVEIIAPFTPKFDFLADRIGVLVSYTSELEAGYDDRIVIYESDADGRPTGAPVLSVIIDTTQKGLRDVPISFSFKKDKLYFAGTRSSYTHYGQAEAVALGASTLDLSKLFYSLKRLVACDDTADYPVYSNDLLSNEQPIPVLMRIAG